MKVIILSVDIVKEKLLKKASKIGWDTTLISNIKNDHQRRKSANELAMKSAKCTLDLLRIGNKEIAIETGMNTIYLFYIGEHYSQVISSVEALKEKIIKTRFKEDADIYIEKAKEKMSKPDFSKKSDRLTALYSIIWEKAMIGTTNAVRSRLSGVRFHKQYNFPVVFEKDA